MFFCLLRILLVMEQTLGKKEVLGMADSVSGWTRDPADLEQSPTLPHQGQVIYQESLFQGL